MRVENQNGSLMCVAYSTTTMLERFMNKKYGLNVELSPGFVYYYGDMQDKQGGMMIYDALNSIKKRGVCEVNYFDVKGSYNYVEQKWNALSATKKNQARYNAKKYVVSKTEIVKGIDNIKKAIKKYGSVVVSVVTCDNFYNPTDGKIEAPPNHHYNGSNHAIVLVDYNDFGFKVQNSWGNSWGNNGFAYLSYDYRFKHENLYPREKQAWVIVNMKNEMTIPYCIINSGMATMFEKEDGSKVWCTSTNENLDSVFKKGYKLIENNPLYTHKRSYLKTY